MRPDTRELGARLRVGCLVIIALTVVGCAEERTLSDLMHFVETTHRDTAPKVAPLPEQMPVVSVTYQADIRYSGQGLTLTVDFDLKKLKSKGLSVIGDPFDDMHRQLFTFALDADKEIVNVRAVAQGKSAEIDAKKVTGSGSRTSTALEPPLPGRMPGWAAHRPYKS